VRFTLLPFPSSPPRHVHQLYPDHSITYLFATKPHQHLTADNLTPAPSLHITNKCNYPQPYMLLGRNTWWWSRRSTSAPALRPRLALLSIQLHTTDVRPLIPHPRSPLHTEGTFLYPRRPTCCWATWPTCSCSPTLPRRQQAPGYAHHLQGHGGLLDLHMDTGRAPAWARSGLGCRT
jgi:hypothetical protein